MKVRWSQDSIRLRITPSELEALRHGEIVEESLGFPGGLFWTVALSPDPAETALGSDSQGVFLSLSETDLAHLAKPDTEGLYFQWAMPQPLRYYVEKDFPCAHPRAGEALEPKTETFAAPHGFEQRKEMANDGE